MKFIILIDAFDPILFNKYSVNIIYYEMDENCYSLNRSY